ncbi:MAG: hypothetical protein P8X69_10800, partial [Maritimibacter sp.]
MTPFFKAPGLVLASMAALRTAPPLTTAKRAKPSKLRAPIALAFAALVSLSPFTARPALADAASPKVAVLSTEFVLPAKFRLLAEGAEQEGVELDWRQVDLATPADIASALEGADILVIDAPRVDDIAVVEKTAGDAIRAANLPGVRISVMNWASRSEALGGIDAELAAQIFAYWVAGTRENHRNLGRFV